MRKILIGGDIVPTNTNITLFERGDINNLFGLDIIDLFNKANYKIFNLECPLTDKETPIPKSGPNLRASTLAVNALKAIKPTVLTLANNHIMDQGAEGLFSTINILDDNNIGHIGAGDSMINAQSPYYFCLGQKRIGIFACAEHEFSIIDKDKPGANPIDFLETPDLIHEIKKECDYLIVLYHGGKEYFPYPSPQLQKVCRKFVSKGADLVVCQHSHCIGCMEKIDNSTIIYGQGNFIFDGCEDECWQTSLLITLDENFHIEYLPIKKNKNVVRMAKAEEAKKILSNFYARSNEILFDGFIKQKYDEITNKEIDSYLLGISGMKPGIVYFAINKLLFHKLTPYIIKRKFNEKSLLSLKNHIECEAHHELILNGINKKIETVRTKKDNA